MKTSIEPLVKVLEIIQALGELLKILGTIRMYIEAYVEYAMIEGDAIKTLLSLNLFKKKVDYDSSVLPARKFIGFCR